MTDLCYGSKPLPNSPVVPRNYFRGARFTWHQCRRHRAILRMVRKLRGRVLDYGCGYGDLTFAISQSHEVTGIDLDPYRIEFACRQYPELGFYACCSQGAPFPDASFDIVVSSVVLNFVEDGNLYLREINRLLRPGGHLVIAWKNLPQLRNSIRGFLGLQPAKTFLRMRTRDQVRHLLVSSGFEIREESCFYDPLSLHARNARDILFGLTEQLLSLLRIQSMAGYFVFSVEKLPERKR